MSKKVLKLLLSRRTFVIILLLLQVYLIVFLLIQSKTRFHAVSITLNIISITTVFYIINRKDKPGYKVTWIVMIMVFPLFGGILYLIFRLQSSVEHLQRKFLKYDLQARSLLKQDDNILKSLYDENKDIAVQAQYLINKTGYPIYQNTDVEYMSSGEAYFKCLTDELKKAERFIFLEYFIISHGIMWDTIFGILKEKVKAGVDVRIIYDDMGCMFSLPDKYYRTLSKMGIKCMAFNPFRPFWTTLQNNRDHRKIVVIDGNIAFTGGINLADEYINAIRRFGHWKDSAVMLRGEGARSFTVMFLNMWDSICKSEENFNDFLIQKNDIICNNNDKNGYVQPYCDSPVDNEYVGENIYLQVINNARKYMYISTPYLIIDDNMMTSLTLAAKSGIDVRIITPHIPDKKIVHITTRSYYPQLIGAGVRIYEYKPGFIHSKKFISDDKTAVTGTANLDFRSLYLHFECGVRMYNMPAIAVMKADYLKTLEVCTEITSDFYAKKNIIMSIFQDIIRLCAPLM